MSATAFHKAAEGLGHEGAKAYLAEKALRSAEEFIDKLTAAGAEREAQAMSYAQYIANKIMEERDNGELSEDEAAEEIRRLENRVRNAFLNARDRGSLI